MSNHVNAAAGIATQLSDHILFLQDDGIAPYPRLIADRFGFRRRPDPLFTHRREGLDALLRGGLASQRLPGIPHDDDVPNIEVVRIDVDAHGVVAHERARISKMQGFSARTHIHSSIVDTVARIGLVDQRLDGRKTSVIFNPDQRAARAASEAIKSDLAIRHGEHCLAPRAVDLRENVIKIGAGHGGTIRAHAESEQSA